MAARISNIFPFFLLTLLCVGGVEGFYLGIERYLLDPVISGGEVDETLAEPQANTSRPTRERIDYSVITRRNLFGPPPQEKKSTDETPAAEEEPLEATELEVVLMGTIGGVDQNSRAIILNKKDRKQELFKVGDSVQGALIKEIQRGKVILNRDDQDEMLDMSEASSYGSRSSRPVSVNPSSVRKRSVVASPVNNQDVESEEAVVKPRVVRPTRRIVRPRRVVEPTPPEATDELQAEDPEEINLEELPSEEDLPDEAEPTEETAEEIADETAETIEQQ
jgi:hypothetical protein